MLPRLLVFILLAPLAWPATATLKHSYQASMDESKWTLTTNTPLLCQIEHEIPQFGVAVFSRQAGRKLALQLITRHQLAKATKVTLRSESAGWSAMKVNYPLSNLKTSGQPRLFDISATTTDQVYHQLRQGMQPVFQFDHSSSFTTVLSTVRFRDVDREFIRCSEKLHDRNFKDVRFSHIHFDIDDEFPRLEEEATAFQQMLQYLQVDDSVTEVIVNGYADISGEACYNDRLSERRAWYVFDLLVSRGVEPKMIRVAYFGEQKPQKKKNHKTQLIASRRVTVELRR